MDGPAINDFKSLRAAVWQKMQYHREALEQLQAKLKQINEVEALAKELAPESEQGAIQVTQPKRYANAGLTDAVRDALKIIAVSEAKTISEISLYLQINGFSAGAAHFIQSLNATLNRMRRGGEIIAEKKLGQRKRNCLHYLVAHTRNGERSEAGTIDALSRGQTQLKDISSTPGPERR